MMVQYVIDCLSRNTAPPWLASADPAVSFTFAGGEKAHTETRIWLPLHLALVNPGTVQTILDNDVTAAGGTAEEWSDGDMTIVRGAQKLRDWIMMKSPRIVWFCCPTPRRQKMIISQQLSLALVISPGNIASSVTSPIWHQTWYPLVNVILCSRFRDTVVQCAWEVAFMNV